MKNISRLVLLLIVLSFSGMAEAKTDKKNVMFNVMMQSNTSKKDLDKLSQEQGILSVKSDSRQGTVLVTYDGNETSVKNITDAFKKIGFIAFPIGENCSLKKGGCLNNAPTEINTMK